MAQTTSSTVPQISGTINIGATPLPGSVAVFVIIHAICLGGAFVLVFPLGVVILRFTKLEHNHSLAPNPFIYI
jgi:hypothetical protein